MATNKIPWWRIDRALSEVSSARCFIQVRTNRESPYWGVIVMELPKEETLIIRRNRELTELSDCLSFNVKFPSGSSYVVVQGYEDCINKINTIEYPTTKNYSISLDKKLASARMFKRLVRGVTSAVVNSFCSIETEAPWDCVSREEDLPSYLTLTLANYFRSGELKKAKAWLKKAGLEETVVDRIGKSDRVISSNKEIIWVS